jgi:hypothetical protein
MKYKVCKLSTLTGESSRKVRLLVVGKVVGGLFEMKCEDGAWVGKKIRADKPNG